MSAGDLFKAGRLHDAVEAQTREVKAQPADSARRLFLFELLAFEGDLDRARKQIDVLKFDEPELQAAVATYRGLLDAEAQRRALFATGAPPRFLGEPPAHLQDRLEAVARLRAGDNAGAATLLARANADLPELRGSLNGAAFDVLRDVDDLFGNVLEVMARGSYFWVPLEQVERLTIGAPRFPRDLIWIPARIELEAEAGDVFLATLYPSSYAHADELVKLGRMTDWRDLPGGATLGSGLRTFLVGDEPMGLLEWRELVVDRPASAPSPSPAPEGEGEGDAAGGPEHEPGSPG